MTSPKPIGSMRARVGDVEVEWVAEVRAPLWARFGPGDEATEDIALGFAEGAGARKVRACWADGMFRVERA